jgi:hypothetical protein
VHAYIDKSGEIQDQISAWRVAMLETDRAQSVECLYSGRTSRMGCQRRCRYARDAAAVGGALAQREAQRMVAEKVTANAEAQAAAITKMLMGGRMAAATKSASAVYQRKVRANRRRLTRR